MNVGKEESIIFLVVALVLVGLFFSFNYLNLTLTGMAIYEQSNSTDFENGTYSDTLWNGSSIVLSSGNLSGVYESQVFDAGLEATWNNISFNGNNEFVDSLFAVDGGGDVYSSDDSGVTWSNQIYGYGRNSDTSYMFSDGTYLYILASSNKEVWRSSDLGLSWSVINDSFADSALYIGDSDSLGNLFVVSGSGDVYLSNDFGVNWELKGDFNGGLTNNPKGIAINSSDTIFIVDGSGSVFSSSDLGVSWTEESSGYGGGSGTDDMAVDSSDNLYILFNKKVYFSDDSAVTWSIVNSDFTPYSNDGFRMSSDESGDLYIADGSGRIFSSSDLGVTWNEKGDFNSGSSSIPWGLSDFLKTTNLSFSVRNCSSFDCSDGVWENVDISNINIISRYFQYKISFSSSDLTLRPVVLNVSVDYDLVNSAPILNITEPRNTLYLINDSLNLDFLVYDLDSNLDSCWYSFDEGINISLPNCQNITFDISEGVHNLTLYANDSFGFLSVDSVSFNVDSTGISLLITNPLGAKTSRTEIPISYGVIGNDVNCWYNVKTSIGGVVIENTSLPNCSSSVFNVSSDGDYIFSLYSNNSLGSSDFSSSAFSVDTSSGGVVVINNGGSSGGGGGGSGGSPISLEGKLNLGKLSDLTLGAGEEKKLSISLENTGLKFLNGCKLNGEGEFSSWVSSPLSKNLGAGEKAEILFDLNVPSTVNNSVYNVTVSVDCLELNESRSFLVDILKPKLGFKILNVERNDRNHVDITYSLEELSGVEQNVELQFLLFGLDGEKAGEITESKDVLEHSYEEYSSSMIVDPSLQGELNLLINLNSETYSSFVEEDVVLGAPLSGYAVFESNGASDFVVSGFLVVLFLVFAFSRVRKIFKHSSNQNENLYKLSYH